jgi:DNA-binding NtrC family response regulator
MALSVATAAASLPAASGTAAPVIYVHAAARERPAVRDRLGRLGVPVTVAADIAAAVLAVSERRFALGLIDLADDRAALTAIRMLRAVHPTLPLAGVVDPAAPAIAAEAMHAGLVDLLPWPFEERDLVALYANARDRGSIDARQLAPSAASAGLFVQSAAMRQVLEAARAAAATRRGLLLVGEPGTGRERVARVVHELGGGGPETFVRVDCAALAASELDLALFGTSGERRDDGRPAGVERITPVSAIGRARHGTLFLLNVTEASARIQSRLSTLLRDAEARVGDGPLEVLDVRPVAATQPDVDAALADGRLRRDLADRFWSQRIDVPSLKERREDIPLLAVHFVKALCDRQGSPAKAFSRSALTVLAALPWHRNARELRELMELLVRAVSRPTIQLDDVLDHARLDGISARIDPGVTLREARARFERECISAVLIRHHGRVGEAAKALGIQRTNLYRKVRQLKVARSLLSARK